MHTTLDYIISIANNNYEYEIIHKLLFIGWDSPFDSAMTKW